MKLNSECALGQLSVVIDADIFNAYIVPGKQRSDGGNRARLVRDIHGKNMFCLDRAAG